jgi:hypothetical protein
MMGNTLLEVGVQIIFKAQADFDLVFFIVNSLLSMMLELILIQ